MKKKSKQGMGQKKCETFKYFETFIKRVHKYFQLVGLKFKATDSKISF